MAVDPRRLLTVDDYMAFPDDGIRRELIRGRVYVTPSATVRHQEIALEIATAFLLHLKEHGGGRVLIAPMDVILSRGDVVQPDVLFVADDRVQIVGEPNVAGAPTLCVEVLSNPRTDRVRKRALYEERGVPTYWIVDPKRDQVEVYTLDGDRYGDPVVVEPGGMLTLAELPEFSIDVAALLRR
ncbi:MAG: Uma2 family endonuclease [Actinomycetota bacterium]